ncbi:MAG: hypothetical protein F6J87_09685 [Spirulina sp. SIO3F2]|nr:hypothetical protein [Spirulina sp. SIO3F2]
MSTELFIQAFKNGKPQQLRTLDILNCFSDFIVEQGDRWIQARFSPSNSSVLFFAVNEDMSLCIMVRRPCSDPKLAVCLCCVMGLGNCVLFEPGARGFIVRSPECVTHMPLEMEHSLGQAHITQSEDEFVALYSNPKVL